ncbi:glycoside hydrolase family 13 protein [Diplodia corticola]|uniref:Glycoside hydrolase family 13 protein n=1 Tax=Diplodia corticola TaxID=236234 RepID=A0A1J9R091_9PEZI|nr:glycoside hydrolase family 13 protein [Diplodia corticola]OJD34782.1 glycoside hydrolase family 13 protein [Diplodia corticola]
MATGTDKQAWWKEAVVYQIYPASFYDLNGDGWGDIKGITAKLDYLKDLGVFKSPQADMGYDIDPSYGTLDDVDELIAELKKRDMKFMADLVVNHTSDQHPWFLQSRSSKTDPYRDWYIWKPPRFDENGNRQPPNNWAMLLGEGNSAWTWDEKTQEYYLSLFTPQQPDLNWECEAVREAVHDVLRFWLDKGACGFRMDVINHISKVQTFPDAPNKAPGHQFQPGDRFFANGPRMHEFLKEMHEKVLSHYDTITVGEMPFVRDEDEIIRGVGAKENELRMIFSFDIVDIDNVPDLGYKLALHPWDARDLRRIVSRLQRLMIERDGWNSVFIENHDQPRSVSRYTDDSDQWRELGAKMLCLMQTTLSGTLYVYQGEELGMRNIPPEWEPSEYKDIETINYWKKMNTMHPDSPAKLAEARHVMQRKARDHARTPMQWTSGAHGGFSPNLQPGRAPWMRVNDDAGAVNAEQQLAHDPAAAGGQLSVRQFWRRALAQRKAHKDVFVYGDFSTLGAPHESVFAYKRWSETEAFVTILNFSGGEVEWEIPAEAKVKAWAAWSYDKDKPEGLATEGKIKLKPWVGLLGVADV